MKTTQAVIAVCENATMIALLLLKKNDRTYT